jgi:hypothetical protein
MIPHHAATRPPARGETPRAEGSRHRPDGGGRSRGRNERESAGNPSRHPERRRDAKHPAAVEGPLTIASGAPKTLALPAIPARASRTNFTSRPRRQLFRHPGRTRQPLPHSVHFLRESARLLPLDAAPARPQPDRLQISAPAARARPDSAALAAEHAAEVAAPFGARAVPPMEWTRRNFSRAASLVEADGIPVVEAKDIPAAGAASGVEPTPATYRGVARHSARCRSRGLDANPPTVLTARSRRGDSIHPRPITISKIIALGPSTLRNFKPNRLSKPHARS